MEGDQEFRFQCKFCNKRFPSGKSLGGHVRSHVLVNSSESDEKFEPNMKKLSSLNSEEADLQKESRFELGGQSGYGLRENPRKTWRVLKDCSNSQLERERMRVCKQCGKGFKSLKALCGHMACHSERVLKDDHSWTSENQKLMIESDTDTEEAGAQIPRRTTSTRYKGIVVKSSCLGNFEPCVSDIEQEQEEIAMCLMMLSRDSGNWGGFNSITESSDNNSVFLETKSSSIELRNGGERNGLTTEIQETEEKKLKTALLGTKIVEFENSDSGYFINGSKKVDSDVSVDGFFRNDEFNESKNSLVKEKGYNESGIASNSMNFGSRKRKVYSSSNAEVPKKSQKRSKYESSSNKNTNERKLMPKKGKGHECPFCLRVFKSGQALGGHKRSHFIGGSQYKNNFTTVINQEIPKFVELIDLNLPAPVEDDSLEAKTSMHCFDT